MGFGSPALAQGLDKQNCNFLRRGRREIENPRLGREPKSILYRMRCSLLHSIVACANALTWHAQPFHVVFSEGPFQEKFHRRDVHLISVQIDDVTGSTATATVHCLNATVPDYTIDLLGDHFVRHDDHNNSHFNGTLHVTGKSFGASLTVTTFSRPVKGRMAIGFLLANDAQGFTDLSLEYGINPPPPPPPPPTCETSASNDECHKVPPDGACKWCESDDGVHAACYHANHLPPVSNWHCA